MLSFSEESLLFYTFFGKAIRQKMFFTYRNKKEKNIAFFNVLILPILSSTIEYCELETPENTD